MTDQEFSDFVAKYEKLVFTICYQFVKDYHEAQNLTQETFLSAYRHLPGYQGSDYKPWLARIAANKAKDFLGSAYHRRVVLAAASSEDGPEAGPIPLPTPDPAPLPDERYIQKEGSARVQQMIRSLKEPYLKVSVLYFLEEKTTEEIAKLLGRPKKTVDTQLYRARRLLQTMLKEERTG